MEHRIKQLFAPLGSVEPYTTGVVKVLEHLRGTAILA
jgi:hypothetical protein